ncbi:MAG TPA: hypothetical protein DC010_09915, partial [Psychrobacter sp.]|nr:hypothetical protein [Psychrobacter sp.]
MTPQNTSNDIENNSAPQSVLDSDSDSDSDSDTNNQAADSFDLSVIDIGAVTDTANLPQPKPQPIK